MQDLVSWETQSGTPIQVDNLTITPQSQALKVQLPYVGFVWSRPSGVLVEENGRSEQQPIIDVTRMALISFLVVTLLFNLLLFVISILRFGGKK